MRRTHIITILVLLALAVPASPVHAGGVVAVCDEAHLLAALAGGGTVTFTCSGTIVLSNTITIDVNTSIDGSGQTVTINGHHAVRVFTVSYGATLNLNRLTITDGVPPHLVDNGGGIANLGTLTVRNSTFSGNSAYYFGGGGIFNESGQTAIVENCTFSSNFGMAIHNRGMLIVNNSIFSDNEDGGVFNSYGTAEVSNSTFSGSDYSGIFNGGALTITNSTFSGNDASSYDGGGISNTGTLIVNNSTFSGNSTYYGGGGIFNSGTLTVTNSTFAGNSATYGGGIYNGYYGTVTLRNTVVANSATGNNCHAAYGTITDGGGNLSYPDTTCPGINADPVLGSLQNNGGPTYTMALGAGSAAIDAAVDATCATAPVNGRDQRGIARPQGMHCDIGAVERYCPSFVRPATVGVEDVVAIATRWGWTNATPGWDPAYDLNGDNRVDIVDIMLVTRVWGGTCS